jgi:hypothetical protein
MARETAQQRRAREKREREAAERREKEAAQRKEREAAQRREREAAQRREREAAQKREREAAQKKEQKAKGAMGRDPKPVENVQRAQERIDYLKKRRPNDPEIRQLERRLAATSQQPAQPQQPAPEQAPEQAPVQPPPPPIDWEAPPEVQPMPEDYMRSLPQMPTPEEMQVPEDQLYQPTMPQPYGDYGNMPLEQQNWEQQFGTLNYGANQGLMNQMQFAQAQGAFNPGSFQQQMDQAYNNVMDQFNRTTQEQFRQEQQNFEQMAAERGLDPSGEAYRALQKQVFDRQDMARQNAMSQAQQAAQGVQAQAYGQAASTYQMPFQQMGAFAPFYGAQANMQAQQQGQQFQLGSTREQRASDIAQTQAGWRQQERMAGYQFGQEQQMFQMRAREEAASAAKAQEYAKELARMGYSRQEAQQAAEFQRQKDLLAIEQRYAQSNARLSASLQPRGGGGVNPFEAYMAKQNMDVYDEQPQPQKPSVGNAAATGLAQGLGAGLTAGLAR